MAEKPESKAPPKKMKTAQASRPTAPKKAAPAGKPQSQKAPQKATAAGTAAPDEALEDEGPSMLKEWLRDSPSWLTSLIVHMVLLLILALWMLPTPVKEVFSQLSVTPNTAEEEEEIEEIIEEPIEELDVEVEDVADIQPQPETDNVAPEPDFSPAEDVSAAAVQVELDPLGDQTAPKSDLLAEVGGFKGTALSGRGEKARSALVRQGGGTKGSEEAVAKALKWLAEHQMANGSWSFDHRQGLCQGRCPNPGDKDKAHIGATAMGLLPFLGAGQTHKEGNYKKNVGAGLYYLAKVMKVSNKGGDLTDTGGRMYSHGLASIALCEAYGMTKDKGLAAPSQAALNFIVYAQDPVGGGWRYQPKQKGDTSVVGWQVMALKSGHMAYLAVPPITVKKAYDFLDSVQVDSGSAYGYVDPGKGSATTAVGLLCRMYLGWKKDNPALERGVKALAKMGPSKGNMYFNYYAMQVMFQFTGGKGEMWKKWNEELRDFLIASQAKEGHAEGSWNIGGDHGSRSGGRLYCTSMATMCLEVYYRHMPIYKEAATQDVFPN